MPNYTIQIQGLSKKYRYGAIDPGTFSEDVWRLWHIIRKLKRNTHTPFAGKPISGDVRNIKKDNNIGKGYFWALRDLNFSIAQGQTMGIIGKNGAGKSTLLKILSRITSPSEGYIKIKGKVSSLLEVGTGFHPELSGKENIFLNGSILGMRKSDIVRQYDEIVEFSGVEKFLDTPVKRYSSGMYIRLAFAIAANLQSDILLVDEILAVGDAEFQKKCLGKMDDVANQGRTVVFVSHNMPAVLNLCEESVHLDNGQIKAMGKTANVINSYLKREEGSKSELINNDSPAIDSILKIRMVRLEDSFKNIKNSFERNEDCNLVIDVEIIQPGKGYNVAFEIYDLSIGVIMCSTYWDSDIDLNQGFYWNKGVHRLSVKLPLQMLRESEYYLKITATIPKIMILDEMKEELLLSVKDDSSPIVKTGEGRRGVILPILEWNFS